MNVPRKRHQEEDSNAKTTIGDILQDVCNDKEKAKTLDLHGYVLYGYTLPIQEGNITCPVNDNYQSKLSGNDLAVLMMQGPRATDVDKIKDSHQLLSEVKVGKAFIRPAKLSLDERMDSYLSIFSNRQCEYACKYCGGNMTVRESKAFGLRRNNKLFCAKCCAKRTKKGTKADTARRQTSLQLSGYLSDEISHDHKLIKEALKMIQSQDTNELQATLELPEAYIVLDLDSACELSWQPQTDRQKELVERMRRTKQRVIPFNDAVTHYSSRMGNRWAWRTPCPGIRGVVLSGNPVNVGWIKLTDLEELNKKTKRGAYSWQCELPVWSSSSQSPLIV